MIETLTPAEAAEKLDELATDAENENYHTVAGFLWEIAEQIKAVTERTMVLIPCEFQDRVVQFVVVP